MSEQWLLCLLTLLIANMFLDYDWVLLSVLKDVGVIQSL